MTRRFIDLRRRHRLLIRLGDGVIRAYRAVLASVALPLLLQAGEARVLVDQATLDVLDAVAVHVRAREHLAVLGHGDAVQLPFELAVLPHRPFVIVGGGRARMRLADVTTERGAADKTFLADAAHKLLFERARVFVLFILNRVFAGFNYASFWHVNGSVYLLAAVGLEFHDGVVAIFRTFALSLALLLPHHPLLSFGLEFLEAAPLVDNLIERAATEVPLFLVGQLRL